MSKNWKIKDWNPSPKATLVVALLALVASMSLPAQAAMERLAAGTVGTAQLKNGAVTTPKIRGGAVTNHKIRRNAVTSAKIADGNVGLNDLTAGARPKHPEWRGSDNGGSVTIRADRWTTALTLNLPAGQWFVFGKGIIHHVWNASGTCDMVGAGQIWDRTMAQQQSTSTTDPHEGYAPMSLGQRVVLRSAGPVEIRCIASAGAMRVLDLKLNAIRVRS